VNSIHHQGVKVLGRELGPRLERGRVVEVIRGTGRASCWGTVAPGIPRWREPELLPADPLMRAFLDAAQARAAAG
jgi:hypothetical protein